MGNKEGNAERIYENEGRYYHQQCGKSCKDENTNSAIQNVSCLRYISSINTIMNSIALRYKKDGSSLNFNSQISVMNVVYEII